MTPSVGHRGNTRQGLLQVSLVILFPPLLPPPSFFIFNFWQWFALLTRSLWGIQNQSVENKKRGNFCALKKPAYSWPLFRATQQPQLSLKAGSTPRQYEVDIPASLLNEKGAGPNSTVISPLVQHPLN